MIAFFEIPTNDFNKSVAFYQALFGEKLEVSQFGDEKMACLMKDGKSVCSISSAPSFPGFAPSNGGVLVYLQTKDLDASVKTALDNGATLVTPRPRFRLTVGVTSPSSPILSVTASGFMATSKEPKT